MIAALARRWAAIAVCALACAAVLAWSGQRHWATPIGDSVVPPSATGSSVTSLQAPGVTALALVMLAAWGALLVTRGWLRRAIAAVASLAGAGAIVVSVVTVRQLPDAVARAVNGPAPDYSYEVWPWLALALSAITTVLGLLAFLSAPSWPSMGSKYEAPAARPEPVLDSDEPADIWRAIDSGSDPTR